MNVTVKNNLIVFHVSKDWFKIQQKLIEEYGPRIALSWVLRNELGFTVRRHQEWVPYYVNKDGTLVTNRPHHYLQEQVHLDFYNNSAQTFFLLKYLENATKIAD